MINTTLFTQIGLDSGALTRLGAVIHPVSEPGSYRGVVLVGDEQVADFAFVVAQGGRTQLDVDVAALTEERDDNCGCGPKSDRMAPLAPGGHLVVHVGSGRSAYWVLLSAEDSGQSRVELDTRELRSGDLFAATVLRPGRYAVTNTVSGASATLEVPYPESGRQPMQFGDPVRVRVSGGFEPAELTARPGQGQLYAVEEAARIVLELVEPYDREPAVGPRYRRTRLRVDHRAS